MTSLLGRGSDLEPAAAFGDDDVTIDRPILGPPPKLYQAVFRELLRLWAHYDRLTQARKERHLDKIDTLAEACVYQWSLAQVARRRFEQVNGDQDCYLESARAAVDGAAQLLAPHLRPMGHMPAQARKRLARLRLSMKLSMSERERGRKSPSCQ